MIPMDIRSIFNITEYEVHAGQVAVDFIGYTYYFIADDYYDLQAINLACII